jgi:hypothetical protein
MKKELENLLTLGHEGKTLRLNGAFELRARYIGIDGMNVELSGKAPADVSIDLVYTLAHDKLLFRAMPITARTAAEIQTEAAEKMETMCAEIGRELAASIRNGYLPD